MPSQNLDFDLVVKKNELDPALDNASKKSDKLGNALSTALGVFGGGVALKGLEALSAGIGNVIDFAQESVKAAAAQEEAQNKLAQALRASGDESKESLNDLSAYGEELEKNSRQSSEAALEQLAYAKSLGLTNQQSKQVVQAAAELSAVFGGSLEGNVALLGKTLNGTSGKLGKLIPELQELTKEQLAAGEAAEIINSKFGGSAASELDSYSGRIKQLGDAYEDLQKQIGGIVVGSADLGEGQSSLVVVINALTQAISDWRIESARANGTLTESSETIDQLKRKYEELAVKLIDAEQIIINPSAWDLLAGRVAGAKGNIAGLSAEVAAAKKEFEDAQSAFSLSQKGDTGEAPAQRSLPQDVIESRRKLNQEILALDQQLILEQNNLDLERDNAQIENDAARQAAELQRITDFATTKTELEYQLKEQQLAATLEGEDARLALIKLSGEKELALTKIRNDGLVKAAGATREAEKKAAQERIALQQATASEINGILGVSANIAAALTKDGSKEQFYIQKSAALAQAIIAGNLAFAQANALPPPANIPAIAAAKANSAIAISGILATALKGFEDGGIIGGEGQGASSGSDNTTFKGREGEMVLTASDQTKLLGMIRNGGGGEQPIIINIDGVAVFKAMRNVKNQGYTF